MIEPKEKKTKIDQATIDQAWEHFRNYVVDDSVDELQELLLLISLSPPPTGTTTSSCTTKFESEQDLLPLLLSTACMGIAEESMSEYFSIASAASDCTRAATTVANNDDDADDEADATITTTVILEELRANIVRLVGKSFEYYPGNAMTYSLAANFARTYGGIGSIDQTAAWYLKAASCSQVLRSMAIASIENDDDTENPPTENLKEWLEVLVLNQICGVELDLPPTGDDDQEVVPHWSSSVVEGNARFMAAMLLSTINRHEEAAQQLQFFPELSHRIHPNVWQATTTVSSSGSIPTPSSTSNVEPSQCPVAFATPVLPPILYAKLCQVFDKDASYWIESDYDARGYYSYFADLPKNHDQNFNPTNAIEEAVLNHLWPRIKQHLGQVDAASIVGYEWWVHTRPVSASFGHNLHFDTDETKLTTTDPVITHPLLSAVLYLTAPPISGATIVFQQTPDATENAPCAWFSQPTNNTLMIFPGNLLHGVLPCKPAGTVDTPNVPNNKNDDDDDDTLRSSLLEACSKPPPADASKHRLSFMVGFWTRRVPDEMKERKLYGPCGPLPSPNEANWVKQLQEGYPKTKDSNSVSEPAAINIVDPTLLPCVTPAWEVINTTLLSTDQADRRPALEVPRAIDHHFFVANAPKCFRESLLEVDDDDDDDDDPSIIDIDEYEEEGDFSDQEVS